ncbi:hypothetical protein NVV31_13620 [Cytobacillus firmus]|uniref:hypothetical protein n=1 Tax=Cytobacillus firmus TaxID=1399 RepID=UPI0021C6BCFB|nr:hypothetical protein [Cytobacillus firmus]MCU1806420.1 hypothetical protein [Cytobacillus firmus]
MYTSKQWAQTFTVQEKIREVSRLELRVMKELVAEAQAENIINSSEDVYQVAVTIFSSVKQTCSR